MFVDVDASLDTLAYLLSQTLASTVKCTLFEMLLVDALRMQRFPS